MRTTRADEKIENTTKAAILFFIIKKRSVRIPTLRKHTLLPYKENQENTGGARVDFTSYLRLLINMQMAQYTIFRTTTNVVSCANDGAT